MKTEIIAEVGWNFMGDMYLAHDMINAAAGAGADVVKFQSWSVSRLKEGSWDDDGRREIYEAAELNDETHGILLEMCRSAGVKFLTSCFSARDVERVRKHTSSVKIASTEITNYELLDAVGNAFDEVYMSTGAARQDEVFNALYVLSSRVRRLHVLHCVSSYPCPRVAANLKRMNMLNLFMMSRPHNKCLIDVGYSGHCEGIDDAIAAIGLGADVVEKHFTTDHDLPGRDNKFAILPEQLRELCRFNSAFYEMTSADEVDFMDVELEAREQYRGRWDG